MSGHEALALDYLRAQLGDRAPARLTRIAAFHEAPLDGEGPATLFAFELEVGHGSGAAGSAGPAGSDPSCARGPQRFYVVAGETQANYFPAYGFDADAAYSFHIGTRFALELRVSRIEAAVPRESEAALSAFLKEHLPRATLGGQEVASVFDVAGQVWVVYRLQLNGEDVYFMGHPAPPGFYRLTHLPPQVSVRLHLGQLIREEARQERRAEGQG